MSDRLKTDYSKLADAYDVDRAHWVIRADKNIAALLEERADIVVLDVACGTGLYLSAQCNHFSEASACWLGVDASRAMLREASAKRSDMTLAEARAEALPVGSGSTDYVYSSFAFHHFTDKERALDEIARVLRTGGRLRVRNMDPWGQPDWWLYEHFEGTWENDQERFWPVEKLAAEIDKRGFEVDTVVEIEETSRAKEDVLEEAERRVISQLAILDDGSFSKGLDRLQTLPPEDPVLYRRARLTLDAIKR